MQTNTKNYMGHTEGAWYYFKDHTGTFTINTEKGNIAQVFAPENAEPGEEEANVKIMNAGSEMLKALQSAKKDFEMLLDGTWELNDEGLKAIISVLDNAINKAIK
jgi:hypothetical protein